MESWRVTRTWYVEAGSAADAIEASIGAQHSEVSATLSELPTGKTVVVVVRGDGRMVGGRSAVE